MTDLSARHDAYAAGYDAQVVEYDCYIAEALFGLSYAFVAPGQRLLDAGIGSGLSAAPFARAGLRVWGMDFAPAMLALCRAKGIAGDLREHDVRQLPWPYAAASFDHVISCGVFQFIADVDAIFREVVRVLRPGGAFAFTTRLPDRDNAGGPYTRQRAGDLDVFSHTPAYVQVCLDEVGLRRARTLRCFVGPDAHCVWVARAKERDLP